MNLRATCSCTSTPLLRGGAVVCASCGAPVVADARVEAIDGEVSTYRLPPDAKSPDAFNRACRSGRVEGARKVGRAWLCSREAWSARTAAPVPTVARAKQVARPRLTSPKSSAPELPAVDAETLAEMGATTRRTA